MPTICGLRRRGYTPESIRGFCERIGLRDHVGEHPDDYREELSQGVKRGIPMVCANPDKQVRVGGKLYWCAGALADVV